MIKAVIFDMDGLMIDSEIIHSKSYEALIKEYGKRPIYKKSGIVQTPGIGGYENLQHLKEKHQITENMEKLLERKRILHQTLLKANLKPMPGLKNLLILLKDKKMKIAVGSSAEIENILIVLNRFKIKKYFNTIISGEAVTKRKPNPDIFLHAAKNLNILPEDCLVLEDAESGIIAAHAAGMKIIAVPNQYTKDDDFSKADMVVNSLQSVTMELINSL